MRLNKAHHTFIDLYLQGHLPKYRCYAQAFNIEINNNMQTLGTSATNLLKKADIKSEIEYRQANAKKIVEQETKANIIELNILKPAERMHILSTIALGSNIVNKTVVIDGEATTIQDYPTTKDKIAAISELNKMDGSYTPVVQKLEVSQVKQVFEIGGKTIEF
jgi:hypothetical protein